MVGEDLTLLWGGSVLLHYPDHFINTGKFM